MWMEEGEGEEQVMRELIRWEWQGGWEKKESKHKETEWKGAGERQDGERRKGGWKCEQNVKNN